MLQNSAQYVCISQFIRVHFKRYDQDPRSLAAYEDRWERKTH